LLDAQPSPKVSVLLFTYNGSRYIEASLDSILKQNYKNFDISIIDDGSADETVSIIQRISTTTSKIDLEINPTNRGAGYCYSRLLEKAPGELVACIGQDDLWDPNYLSRCAEALADSRVAACVCSPQIIDSDGNPSQESPFRFDAAKMLSHEDLACALLKENFLCASGIVFRSKDVRGWNTHGDNDQLQDWNTWQHLILKGPFRFISEKLVSYRVHSSNLSLNRRSIPLIHIEQTHSRIAMILEESFSRFILKSQNPDHLFYNFIRSYVEAIDSTNRSQHHFLLFALRKNESQLRDLPSYRAIMEILFIYAGSFTKAKRYSVVSEKSGAILQLFRKSFEWRYMIMLVHSQLEIKPSAYIKTKKIGPLLLCKSLSPKKYLFPLTFRIDFKEKNTERLLEAHYLYWSQPIKRKISILLRAMV